MLYAGAKGPTAAALGRLLRLPAWNPGLVAALDRHTAALARLRQLAVNNHLFEQSGDRPAQRVLDDLRTAYHAGLWAVDFGDEPATTNRINAVVARETHGLLPALFQAPLPPSTRTVLTERALPQGALAAAVPRGQPGAIPYRRRPRGPGAADEQHRPGGQLPPGRRLAVGHAAVRRRPAGRGCLAPAGPRSRPAPSPRSASGRR